MDKGITLKQTLVAMANLRSGQTVRDWAEKLAHQHSAVDVLQLPPFMAPKPQHHYTATKRPESVDAMPARPTCMACGESVSDAVVDFCRAHAQRFGGGIYCMNHQGQFPKGQARPPQKTERVPPRKRLACEECGAAISLEEGRFCWRNEKRFGGMQYCRAHQANH